MIKKNQVFMLVSIVAVMAASCAKQAKSTNSQEAIQQAKSLKTPEEQAKYLVNEAKSFVSSEKYDEAMKTAQHVLANLDAESQEAKAILERAMDEIKKTGEKAVGDLKKSIGSLRK